MSSDDNHRDSSIRSKEHDSTAGSVMPESLHSIQETPVSISLSDTCDSGEELYNVESHVCQLCSRAFPKRCILLYHMKIQHTKELSAFKCNICSNRSFTRLPALLRHQKKAHSSNIACNRCGQSHGTNEAFLNHACIIKMPYVCEGCGSGFSDIRNLISHGHTCVDYSCFSPTLREYHYNFKGSYRCHTCKLIFPNFSNLIRHQIEKHSHWHSLRSSSASSVVIEKWPGQVSYGLKRYDSYETRQEVPPTETSSINVDDVVSEDECQSAKTFACEFCGIVFNDKNHLSSHLSCKHPFQSRDDHLHVCGMCDLYCLSEKHLQYHLQTAHPLVLTATVPIENCNTLDDEFQSTSHLEFLYCDQQSMLNQNSYCITNVVPNDDPQTSPSDVFVNAVDIEQPSDKDSAPLNNDVSSISETVNMLMPIKKTVDKPTQYQCETCHRTFTKQKIFFHHMLLAHFSIHKCDICFKVYKRREYLLRHQRVVHSLYTRNMKLQSPCKGQYTLIQKSKPTAPKQKSNTATAKQKSNTATPMQKSNTATAKQKSEPTAPKQKSNTATAKRKSERTAPKQNSNTAAPPKQKSKPLPKQSSKPNIKQHLKAELKEKFSLPTSEQESCENLHKCTLCFSSFQTLLLLLAHQHEAHSSCDNYDEPLECQTKKPRTVHRKTIKETIKCHECKREYASIKSLKVHQRIFHKKTTVKHSQLTSTKTASSSTASSKKVHNNAHKTSLNKTKAVTQTKKGDFKCLDCGRLFAANRSLKFHRKTIHGEHSSAKSTVFPTAFKKETFQCPECCSKYSHKCSLNRHRKKVHNYVHTF